VLSFSDSNLCCGIQDRNDFAFALALVMPGRFCIFDASASKGG
jgi:hypothetical protein